MKRISSFSARLKQRRTEMEWSQDDLAFKMNSGKSTISQWEKQTRTPSLEAALQLSDVLHVSALWLFGYDVPQDPHSLDYLSDPSL